MNSGANAPVRRRLRPPGRTGRVVVALGVTLLVGLAGVGTYVYLTEEFGGTTLVVYTYDSLLGGLNCGNATAFQTVFGTFASAHHVRVVVECPPGNLYSTLANQSKAPVADVVIGLDEITAPEAAAQHLLVPYAPPALADVPAYLVSELSSQNDAVPYESGYLALDYNLSFERATGGAVAHASLTDFTNNSSWANTLLVENPTLDITGEEFLLWEIEYYTHVLHQNWTSFWSAAGPGAPIVAPSWGDAFSEFQAGVGDAVVSYSTDPAFAAYYGELGQFNATGSWWGPTQYTWRTIYGVGIVNGTHHLTLAEQFENWFLSGTVESLFPTNEWMYPANATVGVPSAYFGYAIPPGNLTALNNDTTPAELVAQLPGYLAEWSAVAG
jgi:thiamine transport system substrate-binding protein